jgi:ABC-type transport system involved in multi-copper enzyme maturation permease subunit
MTELPSAISSVATIARLTLRRTLRGRTLWIAVAFMALPLVYASQLKGKHRSEEELMGIVMLVACIVQALLVGASIGEEIEDRTTTYLWSRPVPRWTVLVGKLVALAPIGAVLAVATTYVAYRTEYDVGLEARHALALAAGIIAIGTIVAGVATLVPKHGMALAIVYLAIDLVIGGIPWSMQIASATQQAGVFMARQEGSAALALVIIAGAWLALGLARLRRLEA